MWRTGVVIFLAFTASGCGASVMSPRESNPVIEDRVGLFDFGPIGIIATKADRRALVFRDVADASNSDINVEFCAEPPPDVASDTRRELTAELIARIKSEDVAKLGIESLIELINKPLFNRTQGLQLYRDGMYNICILYLNRIVSVGEAKDMVKELLARSHELIQAEIEKGVLLGQTIYKDSELGNNGEAEAPQN